MEGGASAAIEVLIQTLVNVSKEEISLIRGLDKEAQQLKKSLVMIQSYLNDAEKKYTTQAVKDWLKELEEVAFDADNVLDELNYHALHKKLKAMKSIKDKAVSSFHHISRPRQMALRIKDINASFDSINKRATELQLQRILVDAPAAVPDAVFETNSFTLDPIFIERDDDVSKLVEVMTESPDERVFTILAVVGMGGMGKTTLTRKVFNHPKMKARFGCHSWVHVSQTFDSLNIFRKFLASLPSQTGSREVVSLKHQKSFNLKTSEDKQGILEKLEVALRSKTYILVLDDLWNQDRQKWIDFIESLAGVTSTEGNGIIITTRSTEVDSVVNPMKTHSLNGLAVEDCWSIIKANAFEMGDVIPSDEFESIGRNIARRCQGLPLAAKVVGGSAAPQI